MNRNDNRYSIINHLIFNVKAGMAICNLNLKLVFVILFECIFVIIITLVCSANSFTIYCTLFFYFFLLLVNYLQQLMNQKSHTSTENSLLSCSKIRWIDITGSKYVRFQCSCYILSIEIPWLLKVYLSLPMIFRDTWAKNKYGIWQVADGGQFRCAFYTNFSTFDVISS